jgi:ADP-L-glycero-D-manno-heptose 6-epimerase
MKSVVAQAYNQIGDTGLMKLFKSYNDKYEDGGQLRDFVYVKDVVNAMVRLITEDHGGNNGILNLGTGKARSFKDLVTATFKAMDKKENIEFIEMPDSLKGQYQYFTEAKMDKINAIFSDFKFHSLEEGINDYVKNHLSQSDQRLNSRR